MSSTVVIPPADLFPTTGTGDAVLSTSPTLVTPISASLTAPAATPLTLTGGSTGASLVLGQGTSANVVLTPQTSGAVQINPAGTRAPILDYYRGGVVKWEAYVDASDVYTLRDAVNGVNVATLNQGVLSAATFKIVPTTASTSTTSGALQVAGGVGVSGAGYFGGSLFLSGRTQTSLSSDVGNAIAITDTTGAQPTLKLFDAATQTARLETAAGDLYISTAQAAKNVVIRTGNATTAATFAAGGALNVVGAVTANGAYTSTLSAGLNITGVAIPAITLQSSTATTGRNYFIGSQYSQPGVLTIAGSTTAGGAATNIVVNVDSTAGTVSLPQTTVSTNTTSGALIVGGGVGVSGAINLGGTAGFGGGNSGAIGLDVRYTNLSGPTQYGIAVEPVFSSSATVAANGGYFLVQSAAAAFTMAVGNAVLIDSPTVGAASAITTQTGIKINNQGAPGITNAYGIDIAAQSGAATTNIGLRNAGITSLTNTTSASSSTVGALTIGNGTAATNVAIGGGNVWAGAAILADGYISAGSYFTAPAGGDFRLGATYARVAKGDGVGGFVGGYNVTFNSGVKHDSTGAIGATYYATSTGINWYSAASQVAGTAATPAMTLATTGVLSIVSTTPSTGVGSGALQVAGGGGFGGNLWATATADAGIQLFRSSSSSTIAKIAMDSSNDAGIIQLFASGVSKVTLRAVAGGTNVLALPLSITDSTPSTGLGTGSLQTAGGIYAGAASVFGGTVTASTAILSGTGLLISRTGAATNIQYLDIANTGGRVQFGVESSGGGNFFGTSTPYATVLASATTAPVQIAVNGNLAATFASTGAATFAGAVSIGNTVGTAAAVASTHKVTMVIGGVTYYLLATNVP